MFFYIFSILTMMRKDFRFFGIDDFIETFNFSLFIQLVLWKNNIFWKMDRSELIPMRYIEDKIKSKKSFIELYSV
jgi:hypothetical protein